MAYKEHVISTKNELLTSGFRIPSRPDHNGCDYVDMNRKEATGAGVDIIAIADGIVVEYINGNLVGYTVAIAHEGKILSRYQHMRAGSVVVKVGDKIKKGQKLGVMGNTGECYSTNAAIPAEYRGTHLHFAIKENSTFYNNGSWVNPEPYLNGTKKILAMFAENTVPQPTAPAVIIPATGFKTGETVKIKASASKWATGQFIPAWVKSNKYKVIQVGREKILLEGVMSWVWDIDAERV